MKDAKEVIAEFNDIVNMSSSELKSWIETDDSKGAGWTGGDEGGETVGHNSATKIIKILDHNPKKSPDKYSDEDVEHMRKVVAYCKRHMAQEGHMVDEKSEEELKGTKSYKSLKNWGHDPLKVKRQSKSGSGSKRTKDEADEQESDAVEKEDDEAEGKPDTKKVKADEKEEEGEEEEEDDGDNDVDEDSDEDASEESTGNLSYHDLDTYDPAVELEGVSTGHEDEDEDEEDEDEEDERK